jgi:proteasome lid subunit RPN8/RPN11
MTDTEPLTYSVIITSSLPDEAGETEVRLTLGPADELIDASGNAKLLQDCTLAELQQFADHLEAEAWQTYLESTLVDLVVDERLRIEFVYDAADDTTGSEGELLLDHVVIFPETAEQGQEVPQTDTEETLAEEQPDVETTGDEEITGEASDESTAAEVETEIEPARSAAEELIDDETENLVTVAETEPVHEEREAPVETEAPAPEMPEPDEPIVRPRPRILGRRRPLGHSTQSAVDILINETAFRDAQAHAISSPDREVAGVLVGPPPEKQPDARYVVHVSDMIIAKHTRMHGASVTYTPESWRYVNDRLAQLYPDDTAVIVGWYHTHPGFGIFLSGMDQFIHHNFFTQIWHVALVLDPIARRSGFFSWDRARSQVGAYEFPWPDWASESW